jgi:segregation and condensation protein B
MEDEARRAIEAVLMVADTPVEPHLLAQLLEITSTKVEELCVELSNAYADGDRGFVLVRVAGGYRFQSHPDLAGYVERFVLEGQSARLSAAALETLAIVAYKQPVSRAQVAAIRGVNADGVLRTLLQRGYVAEVGRDPGPGQAVLYGTTSVFLERMGLDRIEQLPPLADFVPGPEVMEALEHSLRADPARTAGGAAAEDATADEPTVDGPTVDRPSVDGPSVDRPSADRPSADRPSAEEATVDEAWADRPSGMGLDPPCDQ